MRTGGDDRTLLGTGFLIERAEDRALLEALAEKHGRRHFHGGEREIFFTPGGELIRVGMTLHAGGHAHEQMTRANRAKPERAVERFFRYAAEALRRVHGRLPDGFEAPGDGLDPAVEPARADGTLRIWVRNDRLMYEGLVGESRITLTAEEAERLARAGAWPRDLFVRLGRQCFPRGEVYVDLAPESVEGGIETFDVAREDGVVRGRFRGGLELRPRRAIERGRRAASFRWAEARVAGDFAFDASAKRLTSFRLASTDGAANFQAFAEKLGLDPDALPAKVTAKQHRNVSPELYGSRQPYAVAVELVR